MPGYIPDQPRTSFPGRTAGAISTLLSGMPANQMHSADLSHALRGLTPQGFAALLAQLQAQRDKRATDKNRTSLLLEQMAERSAQAEADQALKREELGMRGDEMAAKRQSDEIMRKLFFGEKAASRKQQAEIANQAEKSKDSRLEKILMAKGNRTGKSPAEMLFGKQKIIELKPYDNPEHKRILDSVGGDWDQARYIVNQKEGQLREALAVDAMGGPSPAKKKTPATPVAPPPAPTTKGGARVFNWGKDTKPGEYKWRDPMFLRLMGQEPAPPFYTPIPRQESQWPDEWAQTYY